MILTCIECNYDVSDKADSCPNCGCPVSEIMANIKPENIVTINGKQHDLSWFVKNMCDPKEYMVHYYSRVGLLSRRTHISPRDAGAICNHIREHGFPQKEYNCEPYYRKRPVTQNRCMPKCPRCGSTNVRRETKRMASGLIFDNPKPFVCSKCEHYWW